MVPHDTRQVGPRCGSLSLYQDYRRTCHVNLRRETETLHPRTNTNTSIIAIATRTVTITITITITITTTITLKPHLRRPLRGPAFMPSSPSTSGASGLGLRDLGFKGFRV